MQWLEGLPSACFATCDFATTGEKLCVLLEPAWVKAAAKRFYKQGYFIEDVTCLDHEEGVVVLYHFDHYDEPGRITVRAVAPHGNLRVPSIADVYHGAEWHERECMDFYPVVFTGNPNPSRLLLPDDMEEKPLVKAEKKRKPMMDIFRFTELGECSPDHSMAGAFQEKMDAMTAAAEEAKAKAEAEAAEAAAKAEAEAAEKAAAEEEAQ